MGKTTLYIVRHGQTEWNVQKRMQGHQDSPLTELGEKQAQKLQESLRGVKWAGVYASVSQRAVRTAEIIRGEQQVPIIKREELREIHLGDWEGQVQGDIKQNDPDGFEAFWRTPHLFQPNSGESFIRVQKRVLPELQEIINQYTSGNVLIVTHTVVVKLLMAYFEGRKLADIWNPPYIHPASLCKVEIEGNQASICLYGDISHY